MLRNYIKKLFSILILLLIMVTDKGQLFAQKEGDIAFALSVGFFSRGIFSVKYFIADGAALELHGGAVPHIWNVGAAINFHPFTNYRSHYFLIGIAKFGFFNPHTSSKYFDEANKLVVKSASLTGINFGYGKDFKLESQDTTIFFSIGPTYVLGRKYNLVNVEQERFIKNEPNNFWTGFFEAGCRIHRKEK